MSPEEVSDADLSVLTGKKADDAVATPSEAPSSKPDAVETPPAAPSEPPDTRQQWVCVNSDGSRHYHEGAPCPLFRSDTHLANVPVECPNCGSHSVQRVEIGQPVPS